MHDIAEIYLGEGFDESLQAIVNSIIKENGGFAVHVLDDLDFLEIDVHVFGDVFRLEFDVYSGAIAKGEMKIISKFANEVFARQRKSQGETRLNSGTP